ncbi:helix-turn-helix domain-containing protein [Microbacterium aquilitoris]|uniref:helix-turn-helix domain-containing protein n=1 Tax=Microbacterium aquilitoris TaxID=3067307 RepID=UPI002891C867|nr:helix-turn-helix domain-containing protein [Microbacterium sp. KSW2-22]MDT3343884.1 helix-turn-helix domain-containing protein [Microbacterium sp. KSW2-22]
MGFRDAEWAYGLTGLAMREKVVLTALCHRTDDKTHETYVGQQTVADMIGSSPDFVRRALRELEADGLITRTRRTGHGGYRTSDLTTVNTSYPADSQQGSPPTRPTTYKADTPDLTGSQPSPTQTTAGAEEITQLDHSEGHSDSVADAFERAWKSWPRKAGRKAALSAFTKAAQTRDPRRLEEDIRQHGLGYARSEREVRWIPLLSRWLQGERWDDDLPVPPVSNDTPASQARYQFNFPDTGRDPDACMQSGQLTRTQQNMIVVEQIAAKEHQAECVHRWMHDGTCNHCTARRSEMSA